MRPRALPSRRSQHWYPKLLNDMPDRLNITVGSHMAEELFGDASNCPNALLAPDDRHCAA